jgi:hypothetical protein
MNFSLGDLRRRFAWSKYFLPHFHLHEVFVIADYITELPSDLRPVARRIPKALRAQMGSAELRLRCEAAAELLDERRTKQAQKVMYAFPLRQFLAAANVLNARVELARRTGNGEVPPGLLGELEKLVQDHPQPIFERAGNGEDITDVLKEVTDAKRRRWRQFWKVKNARS